MRVAAYIRVSTDRVEQADSLINQKEQILQYIKEHNFELFDFYVDVESGTTDKRAGLKRLIEDTEKGFFDVVVCKELSRLARNGELSYKLKRITESNDVHIITMDGVIDTTDPTKQNMFGLYAWMYEEESQRISDRIKSVFKTKSKNGEYLGSIPPYGYRVEDKKLIPRDDDTVDTVLSIYKLYLDNWGVDRIANHLTKTSVPTPSQVAEKKNAGWVWHGSTVTMILKNQAYIGDLVNNKETTSSVTNKKRKKVSKDNQIVFSNAHTPLIERDVWNSVQSLYETKKTNKSISKGDKHLFIGVLKCPDCGRGFHFRGDRKGYICGGYGKHTKTVCTSHLIKEKVLIDIILDDIKNFCTNLETDNILEKVRSKTEKSNKSVHTQIKRISTKLDKLKSRRNGYIDLLADGDISRDIYSERMADNKAEITLLEKEKVSLEDSLNNSNYIDTLTFLKTELDKFTKFDTLTKDMLNLLVDKIEVNENGEPVIYYRFSPVFDSVI